MWPRLEQAKVWMLAHERQLSAGGLIFGFLWDSLTASSPTSLFAHFSITSYFLLAAACIILLNIRGRDGTLGPLPLLTILQFSFGNLTSALLVLYSKSGTLVGGGIFIATLLAFLVGNEFLRARYTRTHIQIATWFLLLLPYATLFLPVLIGKIGDLVFIASGGIALAAVIGLVWVVRRIATRAVQEGLTRVALSVALIYGLFTTAYFFNLIPPVPLSLTHLGMYHALEKNMEGNYVLTYERAPWWNVWRDTSAIFTYEKGSAYCFSSVFAPPTLSTPIFHRWEKFNVTKNSWETVTYISFPINGGREGGYRGYSRGNALTEGRWRCSVETETGALVGRTTFTVIPGTPETNEITL